MRFERRCVRWIVVVLLGWAMTGPVLAQADTAAIGVDGARHLLLRTGFAPRVDEVQRYASFDRTQAVDALLAAASERAGRTATPLPEVFTATATRLPPNSAREQREAQLARYGGELFELRAWWFGEMLATDAPLLERMTLFWHKLFATSAQKVRATPLLARQNQLLRRHALGSFRAMLHDIARDPAMLLYLDGALSSKAAPNENFAREVMELFTLGEGHYSQQDVREAARAFTGYGLNPDDLSFRWLPGRHDDGVKTLFGRSGRFNGDQVLDLILEQPQAARHVAAKLWAEFVAPLPGIDAAADIERVAQVLRASDWQIAPALRVILRSDAFWRPQQRAQMIKSPVELVVGFGRQLGVAMPDAAPLAVRSAQMGQNLFAPPNVKGWPGGLAWIDSSTLLERRRFVDDMLRLGAARPMAGAALPLMADAGRRAPAAEVAAGTVTAPLGDRADGPIALQRRAAAERLRQAASRLRLDTAAWLAQFGAAPERALDAAARQALQQALLAQAALHAPAEDALGLDGLRIMLLDPVYQLK